MFLSCPVERRVLGLTLFTAAIVMRSPALNVSPAVAVIFSVDPLWPEPLTVTALAQVPAVWLYRLMELYQSKPRALPIEPSRHCFEMSVCGLKIVVAPFTTDVSAAGEMMKQRSPAGQAFSINLCRAKPAIEVSVGLVPSVPTTLGVLRYANRAARES